MAPVGARAGLLSDRVRQAAAERVAAGMYPVLVIGVIEDGKSEVSAFGSLPDGKPADGDTLFEIGSITKTFTATLLAEAVRSGRLQLEDPVAKLLPGTGMPSYHGRQITLLDLATQHSGLPRLPDNLAPSDPLNPYADYDATRLKTFLAHYALTHEPGAAYEYSNLGLGLLGYALAERAHTSYATLIARKIFRPLGMSMSGIGLSPPMRAHLAPGFDERRMPAKNWDLAVLAGAGGIRSSAADMLRYLEANLGRGPSPLTAAAALAHQPRRDLGKDERIGLVWMTRSTPDGDIVWHDGMTGGYASFLGFTADRRHGVVVLTDIAIDVDDLGFAALLQDAPLAPAHQTIPLSGGALEAYVGTYRLADHFLLEITRSGDQLYTRATGQETFPIFPRATDEFFAHVAGIALSFTRDEAGAVNGLVLHQNGDHPAPKLSAAALPPKPQVVTLDAALLQDYVGQFQLRPGIVATITRTDAQLSVQLTGQPAFPLYAQATDHFFLDVVDAQIDFERDDGGRVIRLILHQAGHDRPAPRIAP